MTSKPAVYICTTLYAETQAVLAGHPIPEVEFRFFPCCCASGISPLGTIQSQTNQDTQPYLILGGSCIARDRHGISLSASITLVEIQTCIELLTHRITIETAVSGGGYLVTPGWLREWKNHLDTMGFTSSASARKFFGETIARVVLIDTLIDPESTANFERFVEYIGLPAETLAVGIDMFDCRLRVLIRDWLDTLADRNAPSPQAEATQRASEYALAFDLISSLIRATSEHEVLQQILGVFTALFAPGSIAIGAVKEAHLDTVLGIPSNTDERERLRERLAALEGMPYLEEDTGFSIALAIQDTICAVVDVRDLAFPHYRGRYLNLATAIAPVCGLAITNARSFEEAAEARELLALEKERLRIILTSIGDGVIALDRDGSVIYANETAARFLGWPSEQLIGHLFGELIALKKQTTSDSWYELLSQMSQEQSTVTADASSPVTLPSGEVRIVESSRSSLVDSHGGMTGAVLVFHDITVKHRIEEERQIHQRMESLGTLAAGLAHDFNNMLTIIIGNLSLVEPENTCLTPDDQILINRALETARLMVTKVSEVGVFSNGLFISKEKLDLCSLIDASHDLAVSEAVSSPSFVSNVNPQAWIITANAHLMTQVFYHVFLNAIEAITLSGNSNGIITVTAEEATDNDIASHKLSADLYLHICVTNNGRGMDETTRKRAFEPFFTTKPMGTPKGIGLGLTTVFAIVTRNHGGHVELESSPSEGTTVHLFIPGTRGIEVPAPMTPPLPPWVLILASSTEIGPMLERFVHFSGHSAILATTTQKALTAVNSTLAPVGAILIADDEPQIPLNEFLTTVAEHHPELPLILYETATNLSIPEGLRIVDYLPLPFSAVPLAKAVQKVLGPGTPLPSIHRPV